MGVWRQGTNTIVPSQFHPRYIFMHRKKKESAERVIQFELLERIHHILVVSRYFCVMFSYSVAIFGFLCARPALVPRKKSFEQHMQIDWLAWTRWCGCVCLLYARKCAYFSMSRMAALCGRNWETHRRRSQYFSNVNENKTEKSHKQLYSCAPQINHTAHANDHRTLTQL